MLQIFLKITSTIFVSLIISVPTILLILLTLFFSLEQIIFNCFNTYFVNKIIALKMIFA